MESLLFWGITFMLIGIAGWFKMRTIRNDEDFFKYKEYLKAKKDFTKNYFKDEEKWHRAKFAFQTFKLEKISLVFIVVGFILVFLSPFVGY